MLDLLNCFTRKALVLTCYQQSNHISSKKSRIRIVCIFNICRVFLSLIDSRQFLSILNITLAHVITGKNQINLAAKLLHLVSVSDKRRVSVQKPDTNRYLTRH